jgi:hypothetical protein
MMMRRRPLARAAVVGGVAYHAGKSRQRSAYEQEDQDARLDALEQQQGQQQQQQQYAAPPPPAAAPAAAAANPDEVYAQLEKLADLKSKGILTDAEFEVQKAKLLGQV